MKRGIFRCPHMELWDTPPSHLEGTSSGIGKIRGKGPAVLWAFMWKLRAEEVETVGEEMVRDRGSQSLSWEQLNSEHCATTNWSIGSHCGLLQARQTTQRMTSALDWSAGRMRIFLHWYNKYLKEILLFWDLTSVAVVVRLTVQRTWWTEYAAATDDLSGVSFIKLHIRGTGSIFTARQLNDTWSFYANSFPLLVLCNFSLGAA